MQEAGGDAAGAATQQQQQPAAGEHPSDQQQQQQQQRAAEGAADGSIAKGRTEVVTSYLTQLRDALSKVGGCVGGWAPCSKHSNPHHTSSTDQLSLFVRFPPP